MDVNILNILILLENLQRVFPEEKQTLLNSYQHWKQRNPRGDFWNFVVAQGLCSSEEILGFQQLLSQGYIFCRQCSGKHLLGGKLPVKVFCPTCKTKDSIVVHLPQCVFLSVPWSVVGIIGQGGHGTVWRVVDHLSGRTMALKVLHATSNVQMQRFLREIRITSLLEHPAIIPVYQSGYFPDGRPYFIMKEVKGQLLRHWMRENRLRNPDFLVQGIRFLLQVCDALVYAHSKGIVHRDLKPTNIAVSQFSEVLVMDWGIAAWQGTEQQAVPLDTLFSSSEETPYAFWEEGITRHGAMLGTPGYMSPEQVKGEAVDTRSDIYSFGIILYELLVGRLPFQGNAKKRLLETLQSTVTPPHEVVPTVPKELSAIAMKCLESDKTLRYACIEEVKQDLELYLAGRSVSVKRDTVWEKGKKFVTRNFPTVLAASAACVLVLIFWTGWELYRVYEKGQKVSQILNQVKVLKAQVRASDPKKITSEYQKLQHKLQEVPAQLRERRQKLLELYFSLQQLLEQALSLRPADKRLERQLYSIYYQLGELALVGGDYLLAKMAFGRCARIRPEQAEKVMACWKSARESARRIYRQHLTKALERMKRPVSQAEIEETAVKLARFRSSEVVQKLLQVLAETDMYYQRLLAIEVLGRWGERD